MEPTLRLLGRAQFEGEGRQEDLPDGQPVRLFSFLACRDSWVGRDELLGLFWPDEEERTARHNLSQLLYYCKKQSWTTGLETERARLRLVGSSDVKLFREALGQADWASAVKLYRGELLEGIPLDGSAPFENWLQTEREAVSSAWREAALYHARHLEATGRPGGATSVLDSVLRRDPFAEDVLLAQMRCLASDGKRDRALSYYQAFRERLRGELGMEPLEVTSRFAETLRLGGAGPRQQPEALALLEEPVRRSLPSPLTPFVGRVVELAELADALHAPGIRLLTLLGPGGVGKTRLALQVAIEQSARFEDGVAFVPLAPLPGGEPFLTAIAGALGLSQVPNGVPREWLAQQLHDRQVLFVLDNFEHLTAEDALVLELLEASPRSRVLATSRAPVGIQGEHLYQLGGLDHPSGRSDEVQEAYEAVELFLRCARRVRSDFSPSEDDRKAIATICELLQGMPLGLELAANWVRLLSPAEIAAELEVDFDLLKGSGPDLPDRHRSLRAVFDHSWRLLAPDERNALRQLAVFHGGFSRSAADEVVEVPIATLLSLVNKSLLLRDSTGRFERHLAVFGFTEEKLQDDAEEASVLERRQAHYFAEFLDTQGRAIQSGEQEAALVLIAEDLENIAKAWRWAVGQREWRLLEQMVPGLASFCDIRGRFEECEAMFTAALAELSAVADDESGRGLRCKILSRRSAMALRLGHYETAVADATACLEVAAGPGFEADLAQSHLTLGNVALFRGNYADSDTHYRTCLGLRRELNDVWGEANALNNLGVIAFRQGRYSESQDYHLQSLSRKRQIGNDQGIAQSLSSLGSIAKETGDLGKARAYYDESMTMRRAIGDRRGEAICLNNLGALAHERGDFEMALTTLQRSLGLYREIGDRISCMRTLANLGAASCALGSYQSAAEYFREALLSATELQLPPSLMAALAWMGPLLAAHDRELAVAVLRRVMNHPMTPKDDEKAAHNALDRLGIGGPEDGRAKQPEQSESESLEELVARVLLLLDDIQRAPDPATETTARRQ